MAVDSKRWLASKSEITDEHFCVLYRKGITGCLRRANTTVFTYYTPRQCPTNPNCLYGIIPSAPSSAAATTATLAAAKKAESDAVRKEIGDDPRPLLRPASIPFAGLQNLGSTCYMCVL